MRLHDLRVNSQKRTLGTDEKAPVFSWKLESEEPGTMQSGYRIEVVKEDKRAGQGPEAFKGAEAGGRLVWDSGFTLSEQSVCIPYEGKELLPASRYFWRVTVKDNHGNIMTSDMEWFETGLMGTEESVWEGAQWIGSPRDTINADSLMTYRISTEFQLENSSRVDFIFGARDKDDYMAVEADLAAGRLFVREYEEGAWTNGAPRILTLGREDGYAIGRINESLSAAPGLHSFFLEADRTRLWIKLDGETIIPGEDILPEDIIFRPRRQGLRNIGAAVKGKNARVRLKDYTVTNTESGGICRHYGQMDVEGFELFNPAGAVCLRKGFLAGGTGKRLLRARLYASAMGFYDVYINGCRINEGFFNPGFTDYRRRIPYQTYDVTEVLNEGKNVLGAMVAKGYYTGYVGYTALPMVYGRKNAFLCKLAAEYDDGSRQLVVTGEDWQFTDEGPVINGDYQQGEIYDARKDIDWMEDSDPRFGCCGVIAWPEEVIPTNGTLENEKFLLSAQEGPQAVVERSIFPGGEAVESPEGHFVYDLGQNMVGTVRIRLKGERGLSVKLRYGEMCYGDGRIYVANLRSAANTDCYTLKGEENGECFLPSFTCHGFRYIEISGNGWRMSRECLEDLVVSLEGLVLTNTVEMAGDFSCSNEEINRLQSNIVWGQRGNSLLVYTDCPQRNERMGWTGDAQVFAATAAYNMDVRSFMDKWLTDVRDAQLMYNRDGAVPDTAPLGGDNRPMGGCGGWGDAAVIVPWEMYKAYGDIGILKKNYDMMRAWVDYQNREDRRYDGARTVEGVRDREHSDLAREAYIQIQQSRGDHLAFDESTPFILTATAYAAYAAELLSRTAGILGKKEDEEKYRIRHEKIKQAFNDAWVAEDGSLAYWGEMSKSGADSYGNIINRTRYENGAEPGRRPSQTAYALAIDFGLIPKEKRKKAGECLLQAVLDRGGKLSVGFLGISHLAGALCKAGYPGTAFELLEQREHPGWLYSVRNGATTIWERWNSYISETKTFGEVSMNSFNHYSYGAIGEWMYGSIAGIRTGDRAGECGYKRILLSPLPGGSLTWAEGWHESPYGRIESGWRIESGKAERIFHYHCRIPANTTATLILPGQGQTRRLELGSGNYEFTEKL